MALHIPSDDTADPGPMVAINTTPLVDVLLVLLVMLIITIPVQLNSVSIDMPGLDAPRPVKPPEVARIDVTVSGAYLWNGEPLANRAALEQRLLAASRQTDPPEIHLRPMRAAPYDAVAAALSSAQRAGLVKLGLIGSEQFAP
ncbi:MAG TPA: biopolymer transporter ExbD [Ramlibacter sp.]|nr:biopolymer transporter ExbD [Ramlibacter sp.]